MYCGYIVEIVCAWCHAHIGYKVMGELGDTQGICGLCEERFGNQIEGV